GYPAFIRAVAEHEGARVETAEVTDRPAPRWRSVSIRPSVGADPWADEEGEGGGEIQARQVHLVLRGPFDRVYKTVATLCGQQQLFIPDQWVLTPLRSARARDEGAGTELKAEVWAAVFVVREPEEAHSGRAAAPAARPGA